MKNSWTRAALCALGLTLALGAHTDATAQKRRAKKPDAKALADARNQSAKAAKVFREVMNVPEKAIPKDLLDRAEAVAVFPDVLKAGIIIVGGRGGRGVISRRVPGGWSAPAFFNLRGGSFGPQLGGSSTDFVLLFMNKGALQGLLEDKFEIGGEGSVAAGPVGRAASASTNLTLDAGILSYSRSKGLFAGLELKGVSISPDNNNNEAVYGFKARDVIGDSAIKGATAPTSVRVFPLTLSRYSRR